MVEFSAPQVADTPEPFVSAIPENLGGLAVELYARGPSTRDIKDAFTDEIGRRGPPCGGERDHRAAVGGVRGFHQARSVRVSDRLFWTSMGLPSGCVLASRVGQRSPPWGISEDGRKSCLTLPPAGVTIFFRRSFKAALSSIASAGSFFSLAFSLSSPLRRWAVRELNSAVLDSPVVEVGNDLLFSVPLDQFKGTRSLTPTEHNVTTPRGTRCGRHLSEVGKTREKSSMLRLRLC
jgi:hypothetical protein